MFVITFVFAFIALGWHIFNPAATGMSCFRAFIKGAGIGFICEIAFFIWAVSSIPTQ